MFAYYLERGHTLEELVSLNTIETVFMMSAMAYYCEQINSQT